MQPQNNLQHPRYHQYKTQSTKPANFSSYYESPTVYDGSPYFKGADDGSIDDVNGTRYDLFSMSGMAANTVGYESALPGTT